MPHSEYIEWLEYLNTTPDREEILLAKLSYMVARFMGNKVNLEDFLPVKKENRQKSFKELTVDDINKIAGV